MSSQSDMSNSQEMPSSGRLLGMMGRMRMWWLRCAGGGVEGIELASDNPGERSGETKDRESSGRLKKWPRAWTWKRKVGRLISTRAMPG
ncbi:unnamed protein product [Prunus armeniaca]